MLEVIDTRRVSGSAHLVSGGARAGLDGGAWKPQACGVRKVAANETLWCEGDERTHLYIVQSGAVCLSRMLRDGRRIVLGFAFPGDFIGLGSDVHSCDAQTLQRTQLETIAACVFRRAVHESPELARRAACAMNEALNTAYQHVVVISKLSAEERLASFLVSLSNRNEARGLGPLSVLLPMKRVDIADYLGLTIETVSRTFTIFRTAGLICLEQSNIVVFKDLKRLRQLAAGGCDAVAAA
ncbi:MAG: Crp/Fnr family transcriptional regulator [Beijerinckiaceae bacterium]